MALQLLFHTQSEPSVFYLAFPYEILLVEESWEGEKWMQGPEGVWKVTERALGFALHPSEDVIYSIHEDGSLRHTICKGKSWSNVKVLANVGEWVGKGFYRMFILCNCSLIDSRPALFLACNKDEDYTYFELQNEKLLGPFRATNRLGNPFLEHYKAPKPDDLMNLIRMNKLKPSSDNYMKPSDLKDIQTFEEGFYVLDACGTLFEYRGDTRVIKIQADVLCFCLRHGCGSLVKSNGSIMTWRTPFRVDNKDKEDMSSLSRPALLRKTLEASIELGKVNQILSDNSHVLAQYALLPKLESSKVQVDVTTVSHDNVIKCKFLHMMKSDLDGDFWTLKARFSPFNSSEQFYQFIRLPNKLLHLETWLINLELSPGLKSPKSLPLELQLSLVFTAPEKIQIQSRPLVQISLSAFDFLFVLQESKNPIQGRNKLTLSSTSGASIRSHLDSLNAKRSVAKSLLGKSNNASLAPIYEKLSATLPRSAIESQASLKALLEYSEIRIFEETCTLQIRPKSTDTFHFVFKNTSESLQSALKRAIVDLRSSQDSETESSKEVVPPETLQHLRTARKKVDALSDSSDLDKQREAFAYLRGNVSHRLL